MRQQLLYVHGGMTFRTRREYVRYLKMREISLEKKIKWSEGYLDEQLGNRFEIIRPKMPLPDNARYSDWEIHFERYIPFLRDGVILVGNSLGGVFLAKYLSKKKFPLKIQRVILVAPPFDNSLPDEDLVSGFSLRGDLSGISKNCKDVHLFFSTTDDVVPLAHSEKYRKKLPSATFHILENILGHFQVEEFPEVVKTIENRE